MLFTKTPGRFDPGRLVATPAAIREVGKTGMMNAYYRHLNCDWGDLTPDDWKRNDDALLDGTRLFSVYHTAAGRKFYIITEADRSATTVLLPEDY